MAEGEAIVEQASEVLTEGEVNSIVEGVEPEEAILPSDETEFEVPDKFKDKSIEEVIKSYQELEKLKAGVEPVEEVTIKSKEGEEPSPEAKEITEEVYDKYIDKETISEEDYTELEKLGYSKEAVEAEVAERQEMEEFIQYKADKALNDVLEPLGGGTDKFKEVADWANSTKTEAEVKAFNEALAAAPKLAQQAMLKSLYEEHAASGQATETTLHTNQSQSQPSKGYANETEMFNDMSNPAYNTDPKFNKAVLDKLSRSNTEGWSF